MCVNEGVCSAMKQAQLHWTEPCPSASEQATEYEDDLAAMEYTPPEETNRRQRQHEIEAAAAAAEREQKVRQDPSICQQQVCYDCQSEPRTTQSFGLRPRWYGHNLIEHC